MKPKLKKMFALVTAFMMALSIVTPNFAKASNFSRGNHSNRW